MPVKLDYLKNNETLSSKKKKNLTIKDFQRVIKGDLLQFELIKMSQSESDAGRNGRGTFTPMMFVRPW